MIILDTSALIFWTLDQEILSPAAATAIEQANEIVVSSISIWEIALKVKRSKLMMPISIADYVARLERVDRLQMLPVDVRGWLENLALDWDHRDPADRTIVALAARLACPLVTSDAVIQQYYKQSIW